MFELLKMAHLITISMASGLMLAHYAALRASARRESEPGLALARRTLATVTSFAIGLAWMSGLTLLWSRTGAEAQPLGAWFVAKVGFVLLLTLSHAAGRIQAARMRHKGADPIATRRVVERWVSVAWLSALLAICFAVLSFH